MGKTSTAHGPRGAMEVGERKKKWVGIVVVMVMVLVMVLVMGMRTSRGGEWRLI
jgi:hypothetical protein